LLLARAVSILNQPLPTAILGLLLQHSALAENEATDCKLREALRYSENTMQDLKAKTIRGGLAGICAQGASFVLRAGSLMVLARLLSPKDFGLVGMVTAFTGILTLFRDFGLSSAAVQRATVTEEQISTLFWINLLLGALLGLVTLAMAPAIAAFYQEPQLFGVTAVLAAGFLFNAAGTQHSVLLQRQMRFTALAVINIVSLTVGTTIAIAGANAGYGYWALVAMTVTAPFIGTIGLWVTTGWVPGMPHRRAGVRSMMRFGGALTFTGLLVYLGYNAEKIMIGRVWGADAIGIYGRAYQLVNIPTENLNSAVGEVAFSALSRLQDDPVRLKSYFLKGFSLVLGLTLPITIACGLFADDVVFVLLGPKWKDTAAIVRLLAPTIAIFAIINPLGWLVFSIGLVSRGVKAGPVLAALMVTGYVIGLPYGPKGVAFAYSAVLTLWVIPHVLWCVHGTVISFRDILLAVSRPLASGIVAGALAFGVTLICGQFVSPLPRLVLESSVLFVTFFVALLFAAGQKSLYLDLLKGLKGPSSVAEKIPVSI
jgi:O-antigen/teichoic acid export membrane protein